MLFFIQILLLFTLNFSLEEKLIYFDDCKCKTLMECNKCGDPHPKPIINCPCAPPL